MADKLKPKPLPKEEFQEYIQRFIRRGEEIIWRDTHVADVLAETDPLLGNKLRAVVKSYQEAVDYAITRSEFYPRRAKVRP